nr:HD domain-containing protein [uncultured Agathobacter sp.]
MMREQFEYSLINPLLFWSLKTKDEVSVLIGETAAVMVAFDQRNSHHCYDLFLHTMHTVAGIKETAPALLRVAAFFHDIGKPIIAMEKQGRLVFYGHAQKSAKVACSILKEMGYSDADIKEICFYIKHHDDFISWVLPEEEYNRENMYLVPITKENMQKHIEKALKKIDIDDFQPNKESWEQLLELCYADVSVQADVIIQDGTIIGTKEHKLNKIRALKNCLM